MVDQMAQREVAKHVDPGPFEQGVAAYFQTPRLHRSFVIDSFQHPLSFAHCFLKSLEQIVR